MLLKIRRIFVWLNFLLSRCTKYEGNCYVVLSVGTIKCRHLFSLTRGKIAIHEYIKVYNMCDLDYKDTCDADLFYEPKKTNL